VTLSRTHPNLVKKLFALEVPEIADGSVEIAAIAREAGHRTKIAVRSNDPAIDPEDVRALTVCIDHILGAMS
jgi:N utilization substance protein A